MFCQQQRAVSPKHLDRARLALCGEHVADGLESQAQLTQEQDLLKAQQLLALVVAAPAGSRPGRRKQPDRVVVAKGARGHVGHPRHVGDRPAHEHDATC